MDSISKRLKELMDKKNVTPYVVSKETGVSTATLSRILTKNSKPNMGTVRKLAEYFSVSAFYILSGDTYDKIVAEKIQNIDINNDVLNPTLPETGKLSINSYSNIGNNQWIMTMPLLEYASQSTILDVMNGEEDFLKNLKKAIMTVQEPVSSLHFAFRVNSDSMDDGTSNAITRNSVVSARELEKNKWDQGIKFNEYPYWVIYTSQSKMPLLKQIIDHNIKDGFIICHSLNESPEFADFNLPLKEVHALFYVLDIHRTVDSK